MGISSVLGDRKDIPKLMLFQAHPPNCQRWFPCYLEEERKERKQMKRTKHTGLFFMEPRRGGPRSPDMAAAPLMPADAPLSGLKKEARVGQEVWRRGESPSVANML